MPKDEGHNCAQCGSGRVVTEDCKVTEDDFSQIRVCMECGAHGVRYGVFGVDIERAAGPVYDAGLGDKFIEWCKREGLIDRDRGAGEVSTDA